LSTADLKSGQKAMIGSGIFVFVQFLIFLLIGSLIFLYNNGAPVYTDREFPLFIADALPLGIKGLLLAGILSSAMSTLSSSINSLASTTVSDWFKNRISLKNAQFISAGWAVLLLAFALLFNESNDAIVILALQIASFTYGGLLGFFILAKSKINFSNLSLIAGLIFSVLSVILLKLNGIAWTWYITTAILVNLLIVAIFHIFTVSGGGRK
jgi:Na+/proline symporter